MIWFTVFHIINFRQLKNLLPLEEDFLICLEKKIRTFSLYFISVRSTIPYRTQRLCIHIGFLQHPIYCCGADHSLTKLSWINLQCWFFCISSQRVAASRDDFCHAPGDFYWLARNHFLCSRSGIPAASGEHTLLAYCLCLIHTQHSQISLFCPSLYLDPFYASSA